MIRAFTKVARADHRRLETTHARNICGDALCVEAEVYLKCIYQSRPAPTTAVLMREVQKTGTGTLYMDVYAAPICRIFKSKIQVKP